MEISYLCLLESCKFWYFASLQICQELGIINVLELRAHPRLVHSLESCKFWYSASLQIKAVLEYMPFFCIFGKMQVFQIVQYYTSYGTMQVME
ncbi:MAG: hypothetical protein ACE5J3_13750 [Methanosarcinales archaeon]